MMPAGKRAKGDGWNPSTAINESRIEADLRRCSRWAVATDSMAVPREFEAEVQPR